MIGTNYYFGNIGGLREILLLKPVQFNDVGRVLFVNLRQLQYATFLADHKHYGKTAELLGITQPTLSQQILALEKELGTVLFVRSHKGVALTDAGQEFIRRAKSICSQLDDLKTSMMEYSNLSRGKIRVGVLPAFSYLNIINMITAFRQKYQGISIEINVQPSSVLLEGLFNHQYDAVFMTYIADGTIDDEVEIYTHSVSQMAILFPIDHPFAHMGQIDIRQLDGQNLVAPVSGSPVRKELDKYLTFFGIQPNIICESSNVDTLFRCVRSGLGSACIDYTLAKDLMTDDVLLRPLVPQIEREICFAVLKTHRSIPSLKAFRNHIFDMVDQQQLAKRLNKKTN